MSRRSLLNTTVQKRQFEVWGGCYALQEGVPCCFSTRDTFAQAKEDVEDFLVNRTIVYLSLIHI